MFTNWLTSPSSSTRLTENINQDILTNILTKPPNVLLEIGPNRVRYMAHSLILSMHSGYLRSVIRIDDNNVIQNTEITLYLNNITPEQFGPLLTYMYTGYLDLNMENIFGVLLATHVLHMPRPLEICRAYLSRTQNEGYLNNGPTTYLTTLTNTNKYTEYKNSVVKVIKPIASRPITSNLGFIVPPLPHISLPSTCTPFRILNNNQNKIQTVEKINNNNNNNNELNNDNNINEKNSNLKLSKSKNATEIIIEKSSKKLQNQQISNTNLLITKNNNNNNNNKDSDNDNKTIIDIACCDGPIRFHRVLNDAYGKNHKDIIDINKQNIAINYERTHQSVSKSFHKQMARDICQMQRQQQENQKLKQQQEIEQQEQQILTYESEENSEDSKNQQINQNEIYNCIYCKHKFKSQYCYQKHAKRHLNPLNINQQNDTIINSDIKKINNFNIKNNEKNSNIINNNIKREVKPLDMNVQYYPCKTCGSKFPSYYFVHKHRKLCHSNEDNNIIN